MDVELRDDEIARRRGGVRVAAAAPTRNGVLAKYARLVSSASEGAVTRA